jgi:pyridoxal phosphate enzyme (YggS family)
LSTELRLNLLEVTGRIERARAGSPRASKDVTLVVVTKGVPGGWLAPLLALGAVHVGENRVAEAEAKRPGAPAGLVWHGIGHLQRNKAARGLQAFDVFHALDSLRLAERLSDLRGRAGAAPWPVYLEVNASGEAAKGGVAPEDALPLLRAILPLPHLDVRGFMTLGPLTDDEDRIRAVFRSVREIRDEALRTGLVGPGGGGLSMGMSGDYPIAVEEGATIVRVGSAIFRGLLDAGPVVRQDWAAERRRR